MFDTIKRSAFAAVLVASSAIVTSARATSLVQFTTEDLAHVADVIVVAEIRDVVFEHEGSVLVTRTEAKVLETWKGDVTPGTVVDVVEPGGRGQNGAFDVHGTAGYLENERVVLFLSERATRRGYLTVGMFQGKFTLLPAGNGKWQVSRVLVPLAERGSRFDIKKVALPRADAKTDLATFATKVKGIVRADLDAGVVGKELPQYKGIGR